MMLQAAKGKMDYSIKLYNFDGIISPTKALLMITATIYSN